MCGTGLAGRVPAHMAAHSASGCSVCGHRTSRARASTHGRSLGRVCGSGRWHRPGLPVVNVGAPRFVSASAGRLAPLAVPIGRRGRELKPRRHRRARSLGSRTAALLVPTRHSPLCLLPLFAWLVGVFGCWAPLFDFVVQVLPDRDAWARTAREDGDAAERASASKRPWVHRASTRAVGRV